MGLIEQCCPLCDGPAEYLPTAEPVGKRFSCGTCTEFFVDRCSEDRIAAMPETFRSDFKARASKHAAESGADRLFVIREPRRNEEGGDGHGVAKTSVIAEWVLRQGR